MGDENYFEIRLNELKEIDESIEFCQSFLSSFKKNNTDNEDNYDVEMRYQERIEELKEERAKKNEEINNISFFNTRLALSFLTKVLNDLTGLDFKLLDIGDGYVISSEIRQKQYGFAKTDNISLYMLISENVELLRDYPELTDVIKDVLRKTSYKMIFKSDGWEYKDQDIILKEIYAAIPANNANILKDKVKMSPRFKDIINDLVDRMYEENEFEVGTMDDAKALYKLIVSGSLNHLLEIDYWFGPKLSARSLIEVIYYARKYGIKLNLTMENYIVFVRLIGMMKQVEYLDRNETMYISLTGHTQTMATKEEREMFDEIFTNALTKNYSWREARELSKAIINLDYDEDVNFPHNIEEIKETLRTEPTTLFDKLETELDLKSDLRELNEEAKRLYKKLEDTNDIRTLFNEESQSPYDTYLRRMVLANWDVKERINKLNLSLEDKEELQKDLIHGSQLSDVTLQILFDDNDGGYPSRIRANEKYLVDLAKGTIKTFMGQKRIENLFAKCMEIQKSLNIHEGTLRYGSVNTHGLPNGDQLVASDSEAIKPRFANLQKQYDYLYDKANDAEFLEGAIEIYGDIIVMQGFMEGNKRTAKGLFNAMLLSRGIIPPVNDLLEQNRKLFLDIAYGRFSRYMKAKYKLLLQTADVQRQFKEGSFNEPLSIEDIEDNQIRNI